MLNFLAKNKLHTKQTYDTVYRKTVRQFEGPEYKMQELRRQYDKSITLIKVYCFILLPPTILAFYHLT